MNLFVALAGIEFAWTAVILLLEQRDLEGWVAGFIKKLMGASFFYALLPYGPRNWIPAIINSFTQIGQSVGGTGALTPESILQAGITMAGQYYRPRPLINIVAGASRGMILMVAHRARALIGFQVLPVHSIFDFCIFFSRLLAPSA